ncbi:winged helix-turn-helix transcriptional regulator [Pannonibacter sp. Pt2-lr]
MESVRIDEFDVRILRELGANGRLTVQELSERVGLSPTPVARRVRQLEAQGIITGYAASSTRRRWAFPSPFSCR